jgi:uncharacterized protein with HEPN domain
MSFEEALFKELFLELEAVKKAQNHLQHSYKNCCEIGIKNDYSFEELMQWEAFTARYSRLSDILTQKVLNNITIIETKRKGSLLDKANLAVQQKWVNNMEDFRAIRTLRNYIAHEYLPQDNNAIFLDVKNNFEKLNNFAINIINYCETNPIYKL